MRNILNPFARWQHHMRLSTDYVFFGKLLEQVLTSQ